VKQNSTETKLQLQSNLKNASQKLDASLSQFSGLMDELADKVRESSDMIHTVRHVVELPEQGLKIVTSVMEGATEELKNHPKRYLTIAAALGTVAASAVYLSQKNGTGGHPGTKKRGS
jgi:ElaB/YqjD/DUF883 family membrane-anchored ribosome-binding protein